MVRMKTLRECHAASSFSTFAAGLSPFNYALNCGHGHFPEKRQTTVCASGKAYYVCAAGPFKGCCSSDPCSSGLCRDDESIGGEPNGGWPAWTIPEFVTQTQAQTQTQTSVPAPTDSYTTTVTKTLSPASSGESLTGTLSPSEISTLPLVSSIVSEISMTSSLPTFHASLTTLTTRPNNSSSSTHSSSSTTKPNTSTHTSSSSHNGTTSTSPHTHAGTAAGIALGTAGAIALLILLCCLCCRRRKKNVVEDKELKRQLKEAAAIQAERNKALRALENRRTGVMSESVWGSSGGGPRHSTGFPGLRREV